MDIFSSIKIVVIKIIITDISMSIYKKNVSTSTINALVVKPVKK